MYLRLNDKPVDRGQGMSGLRKVKEWNWGLIVVLAFLVGFWAGVAWVIWG